MQWPVEQVNQLTLVIWRVFRGVYTCQLYIYIYRDSKKNMISIPSWTNQHHGMSCQVFFDVAQLFLSKGNSPSKSPGSASPWCGNSLFCFTFCHGFLEFYHLRGKKPTSMPRFPQQISWPVWRDLNYCCPFTSCGLAISWVGGGLGAAHSIPMISQSHPENRRNAMRPVRNKACAVIQLGDDL